VQNRLLEALPAEDFALIAPQLSQVDLERGRLLYDPGDLIDVVYFPHDGVISLMTLMENGAAIESATIGCEGALGLMAAVGPRQSLSRAIVQTPTRASRISAAALHDAWLKSGHRHAATCVECHLPHQGLAKWMAKAEHGFRHSAAFTLQNFKEPIEITAPDRRIVLENCVRCHAAFVHDVLASAPPHRREIDCLHGHAGAGHGGG